MSGLRMIIEDALADYGVFGDNAPLTAGMADRVERWLRSEETVRAVLTHTGWPATDVNVRDVRAVLDALATPGR